MNVIRKLQKVEAYFFIDIYEFCFAVSRSPNHSKSSLLVPIQSEHCENFGNFSGLIFFQQKHVVIVAIFFHNLLLRFHHHTVYEAYA